MSTSTVREALTFSALLRQPAGVPREDKLAYVEEVIRLLEMEAYAEAIVGEVGMGLNVEQRKRLTMYVSSLSFSPRALSSLETLLTMCRSQWCRIGRQARSPHLLGRTDFRTRFAIFLVDHATPPKARRSWTGHPRHYSSTLV